MILTGEGAAVSRFDTFLQFLIMVLRTGALPKLPGVPQTQKNLLLPHKWLLRVGWGTVNV